MSEIAATLGLPAAFVWKDGKSYPVAARTFEVEGLFSTWVEFGALNVILRHKDALGPAGVAMQMDGWRRECAAHVYDWDGVECWQARLSVAGRKHLAALQLCKAGMALPLAQNLVEEVYDDEETEDVPGGQPGQQRKKWFGRLEDAMARANADPNRPRPFRRAIPPGV